MQKKKGFDPELLAMIPQPVQAIIFLFPITDIYEKFKDEEEAHLIKCEQAISPDVIFFKQTISNACGMMAILHSIASNDKELIGNKQVLYVIEQLLNYFVRPWTVS
jgi:ubiquitin carboxyl-terminal hydrolase L3